MSQHKKTLAKLRQRPINVSIRFEEVDSLLLRLGFKIVKNGGSHIKYRHNDLAKHISIKKMEVIQDYSIQDICDTLIELGVEEDV